jgi:DNA repair proteins
LVPDVSKEVHKGTTQGPTPSGKLAKFGASTLSDEELLAVIFGSGTKGEDVISLASK